MMPKKGLQVGDTKEKVVVFAVFSALSRLAGKELFVPGSLVYQ
jgi:hypothetical protein